MRARSLLLLLLSLVACKDREQLARETGEAARAEVGDRCAADAGPDGADACAREACSSACAGHAAMATFHRACVAACVADAECATDADCRAGTRCVAIAPRVRRCGAPSSESSARVAEP